MRRRTPSLVALALTVAVLAVACSGDDSDVAVGGDETPTPTVEPTATGDPTPTPHVTPDPTATPTTGPDIDEAALADLDAAEAAWAERGLSTYSFTVSRFCECLTEYQGPFAVSVVDGEVASVSTFGEPAPDDAGVWTIPEMLDEIRASITSGAAVDITYDPTYGHPVDLNLDLDAIAVDGGVSLRVESFFAAQEAADMVAEARARWDAAGIDSYDLVYRENCFCIPVVVTSMIRPGVDPVWRAEADAEGVVVDIDPDIVIVEDIFDAIDAAIASGPASLTMDFDEVTGAPISYFVDESLFMADEEYGISVESLTPVP